MMILKLEPVPEVEVEVELRVEGIRLPIGWLLAQVVLRERERERERE